MGIAKTCLTVKIFTSENEKKNEYKGSFVDYSDDSGTKCFLGTLLKMCKKLIPFRWRRA